jgi:hypothetical protein
MYVPGPISIRAIYGVTEVTSTPCRLHRAPIPAIPFLALHNDSLETYSQNSNTIFHWDQQAQMILQDHRARLPTVRCVQMNARIAFLGAMHGCP